MTVPLLLDTCALIWLAEESALSRLAREELAEAERSDQPLNVSAISAWEVGLLVSKGRLRLALPPERWFERIVANPNMRLANLTIPILIASSFLPGSPPADPTDRIILATARLNGYRVMTRDRPLLRYAEEGHIAAVAC